MWSEYAYERGSQEDVVLGHELGCWFIDQVAMFDAKHSILDRIAYRSWSVRMCCHPLQSTQSGVSNL